MNFRISSYLLLAASILTSQAMCAQKKATYWLTTPDRSSLLQLQKTPLDFAKPSGSNPTINVDDKQTFQTMDGFGFALTGGSAQLIMQMDPAKRAALLHELFTDNDNNIGVSYLRVSIGSSDMNAYVFSYDDLPEGQTDPEMAKFDLGLDRKDVIPVLKQILAINPKIKILGSPWSAPLWMKMTGKAKGGVLKPEYFAAYATYFVKYIEGMKAEGIPIDAITIQNEPLNEKNTPSMVMLAPEEADFIENDLGPAFAKAGIKTKIVLYDHNLDHPAYPRSILKDPAANKYVDGTGFHLYGGTVDAMTQVHNAFPDKNMYFTEQSVTDHGGSDQLNIARPVAGIVIGVARNWSKNVLLWNLAADPQFGPHTNDGGCTGCQGALTIDGSKVTRNLAFYTIAHASKFVPAGSVRIGSNDIDNLPNVAFKTPEGKEVLIVANPNDSSQTFNVSYHKKAFTSVLGAGDVATYIW
ncbi:glycoside hydrolase family 30 protein [Edaphobacter dinghuensis]|uniref:Glucosylceramidase n=1 Tax=Edaphobacter dinghuensis TaxID=1560005 RepID=A0A917M7Z4_9BACT|nr:glycoside hydrolase family 30 beta sandwich domain-containing protein [Edaphobacter dinghuensis]GGG80833.1 glucosylceramidase [Edaphobacter dinghuensis]